MPPDINVSTFGDALADGQVVSGWALTAPHHRLEEVALLVLAGDPPPPSAGVLCCCRLTRTTIGPPISAPVANQPHGPPFTRTPGSTGSDSSSSSCEP